jgi:hypothetical protein
MKAQLLVVERASALVVRLAAKVLLGKEDLLKSATASNGRSDPQSIGFLSTLRVK